MIPVGFIVFSRSAHTYIHTYINGSGKEAVESPTMLHHQITACDLFCDHAGNAVDDWLASSLRPGKITTLDIRVIP